MLGAFALVDGFGVGLDRTAVGLEAAEFAHGAGGLANYGRRLVTALEDGAGEARGLERGGRRPVGVRWRWRTAFASGIHAL